MSYMNQKEYDDAVVILELREKLYSLHHFGEFSVGDTIDSILHRDARSYSLKTHEWGTCYNLYVQGKTPFEIASHICDMRGFSLDKRMK